MVFELTEATEDNKTAAKAESRAKAMNTLEYSCTLDSYFIVTESNLSCLDSTPYLKGILPTIDYTDQGPQ